MFCTFFERILTRPYCARNTRKYQVPGTAWTKSAHSLNISNPFSFLLPRTEKNRIGSNESFPNHVIRFSGRLPSARYVPGTRTLFTVASCRLWQLAHASTTKAIKSAEKSYENLRVYTRIAPVDRRHHDRIPAACPSTRCYR